MRFHSTQRGCRKLAFGTILWRVSLYIRFSCLPSAYSRCESRGETAMKLASISFTRVLRSSPRVKVAFSKQQCCMEIAPISRFSEQGMSPLLSHSRCCTHAFQSNSVSWRQTAVNLILLGDCFSTLLSSTVATCSCDSLPRLSVSRIFCVKRTLASCCPMHASPEEYTKFNPLGYMASRKGFRIQRYAWCDGYTLMRRSAASLPNLTHFLREDGLGTFILHVILRGPCFPHSLVGVLFA